MPKRTPAQKLQRKIKGMEKRGYIFPNREQLTLETDLYAASRYILQSTGEVITGTRRRAMERSIAAKKGTATHRANKAAKEALAADGISGYNPPSDITLTLKSIRELIGNWKAKDIWTPKKSRKKDFASVKESDKDKLEALLNREISVRGEAAVAIALYEKSERVNELVSMILYGGSGYSEDGGRYMQAELTELAGIIRGRMLNSEESKDIEQLVEQYMPA